MHTLSRTRDDLGLIAGFALAALAGLGAHEAWYSLFPVAHNGSSSVSVGSRADRSRFAVTSVERSEAKSALQPPAVRSSHRPLRVDSSRAKQDMVVLRFRQHSWVTVIDNKGLTRIHALYRTGERLKVPHEIGMKILLGNPDGVMVSQRHERIHVVEARPGKVPGNT